MSGALPGRSARHLTCALFLAVLFTGPLFSATFIPGDANSSGAVNLTDAVAIFRYLYLGDGALLACRLAADVDGNARIDLTDGIRLLGFLFLGGEPPVGPQSQISPDCNIETPDNPLGCDFPLPCGLFLVLSKDDGGRIEHNKFKRLQLEAARALNALWEGDEFGIVFYDAGLSRFPDSGIPARATAAMKAAGINYVIGTSPGLGGCAKPALLTGLSFAGAATSNLWSILYLSDGVTICEDTDPTDYQEKTLREVRARNTANVRIDTIGVSAPDGPVNEIFLRRLAAENGGTYRRIGN